MHTALDIAGMIPVIGEAADLTNGLIYAAEKDYVSAGISIAAVIPAVGEAGKAAKYGSKLVKAKGNIKAVKNLKSGKWHIAERTAKAVTDFNETKITKLTGKAKNSKAVYDYVDVKKGDRYTDIEIKTIVDNLKGNGFKNSSLRQAYEKEVVGLKEYADRLLASGNSEDYVARVLNQERRNLGIKYKDATPQPLREYIYEINIKRYGDKLGPTYEYMTKVRKKTNTDVIKSSSTPNDNIDRLLYGFEEWLRRQ